MSPWWRKKTSQPPAPAASPLPGGGGEGERPPPAVTTIAGGPPSVAVGGDNPGIVSTGPDATNIQAVLPVEALRPVDQVIAPPGLVNVPAHAGLFVGRSEELARLEQTLGEDAGPVVVTAVHGVGAQNWASGYDLGFLDRRTDTAEARQDADSWLCDWSI